MSGLFYLAAFIGVALVIRWYLQNDKASQEETDKLVPRVENTPASTFVWGIIIVVVLVSIVRMIPV